MTKTAVFLLYIIDFSCAPFGAMPKKKGMDNITPPPPPIEKNPTRTENGVLMRGADETPNIIEIEDATWLQTPPVFGFRVIFTKWKQGGVI
jgi:hypothetical protein